MKTKIFIPIVILALTMCYSCGKIESEHDEAANLEIRIIDFSKLKHGKYNGYYAGGMCGWRENECLVFIDSIDIDSSRVTSIELIRSAEGCSQSFFQELYGNVVDNQSLQVDVISGATLTSKAHLKAIEDALLKSEKEKTEQLLRTKK